jgi:hypothetical protein
VGAREVGVEPVADPERPARPQPVQRGEEQLRLGLADADRLGARGVLERRDDRPRARPRAVGHREGLVTPAAQQRRAAAERLGARRSSS